MNMKAVIVGISGIGKEYYRLIDKMGGHVIAIVDFPDALERETRGGILRNTFDGYEFEYPIRRASDARGTLLLTPEDDASIFQVRSPSGQLFTPDVSHVFICTPPTKKGRAGLRQFFNHPNRPIVHVEKPVYTNRDGDTLIPLLTVEQETRLSCGYLTMSVAQIGESMTIRSPMPAQGDWRWPEGVHWDLGGHALAWLYAKLGSLPPTLNVPVNGTLFYQQHGVYKVDVGWVNGAHNGIEINGVAIDWLTLFTLQMARIDDEFQRRRMREVAKAVETALLGIK